MKNIRIFIPKFSFFGGKSFSVYLNRRVFVMAAFAIQNEPSEISALTLQMRRLIRMCVCVCVCVCAML